MEVSIQRLEPGARSVRHFFLTWCLLTACLLLDLGGATQAYGFTLFRLSSGSTLRLDPNDILQGGAALGPASEQSFGQGSFPLELYDFSQPLDLNLSGVLAGSSLSTRLFSDLAFAIRLSRSERDQCLNDTDFQIRLQTVNPANAIVSDQGNGGQLQVRNFEPQYRGSVGGRCPNVMYYGFTLDLSMEDAIAAGTYSGTTEVTVERTGGGTIQTAQMSLQLDMPSMLLLYHPDRIDVDLRATAIASLLGANTSCGGDRCLDLGNRALTLNTLDQPIPVGIGAAVGPVATIQTVTLRNAVGARATGCVGNTYSTADYQIVNAVGGIRIGSGVISGLVSQSCGLDLRTGDISFDLDLAQAASTTASATIEITVTGI